MKKVLSTVAALGLVAGLASTAAAVEFKMSGKYMVEGAYLSTSDGNGAYLNETAARPNNPSDAYFMHTFEIKPTMVVNDKISMFSTIRLADDTFWGSQGAGDVAGGNTMATATASQVYVHRLFMEYASPIGKFRLGRTPAGDYGTNFMDFDKRGDRVMLWPSFLASGPVTTLFYIEKATDFRNTTGLTAINTAQSDADSTKYVARVYYNTDTIDTGLEYAYANNHNGSEPASYADDAKQNVTVYGKFKLDNYFVNGELTHYFGSKDNQANVASANQDYDSWAGMLQVGGKFDALTPSLAYFYAQGQDRNDTDIQNALGSTGTGNLFEPLYILTGRHTGMLNNEIFGGTVAGTNTFDMSKAGVHAIVAAADYAVSKDLTLHGAIGWAKADEAETATRPNRDDAYGWEYNVGAAYKLLDNLTYEAHFGYLATGDYFKSTDTMDDTKNIYLMTHSLTMSF